MSTIADKTGAVNAMSDDWDIVDALLKGTSEMRKRSTRMLPKWPKETDENYRIRLTTATLYPAYSRTVNTLAGKPFSKPITYSDDFNKQVEEWLEDADREGRNLDAFAAEVLECSLGYGQSHIFVDYPAVKKMLNKQEEKDLAIRPYLVLVKPTQLLGWRTDEKGALTQVRFIESILVNDGDYGQKMEEQIRVLEVNSWSVWRKQKQTDRPSESSWVEYDKGANTLGVIPFVTVYGRRIAHMMSRPPLMELAHLNVKHWQSQSDQDNLLHVARVPILAVAGVDDSFQLVLGSNSAVKLPVGATMSYCEHSGSAIGAGKVSLDDLKEEMRQSGAEMMAVKPGPSTRIEAAGDASSSLSDLQRVVLNAEDALDLAIEYMGMWSNMEEPGNVTLFNDFGVLATAETSATVVMQASTGGITSKQTAFEELQRRGILSADRDWEEEQGRIDDEGPPVGKIDPTTGLPFDKPTAPVDPNAPKAKIDPHTNLPYTEAAPPKVILDQAAAAAKAKASRG